MSGNLSYWFLSAVKDTASEILYFMGNNIKGLFAWDLRRQQVLLLNDMSDRAFANEMYDCGIISGGKLYFPPRNTIEMAVYDISKNEMTYRELYSGEVRDEINYRPELLLGHFIAEGKNGKIYVICREYPIITRIDTYTEEKKYFSIRKTGEKELFLAKSYAQGDGKFFFPSSTQNAVLVFDTEEERISCIRIDKCNDITFSSGLYHEGSLILLSLDSRHIVQYNIATGDTDVFEIELEEQKPTNMRKIRECNGFYYILPIYDNETEGKLTTIYKLNSSFEIVEKKEAFQKYGTKKKWNVFSEGDNEWYFLYDAALKDAADAYWAQGVILVSMDVNKMECSDIDIPCVSGWSKQMMSDRIAALQTRLNFKFNSVTVENVRVGLRRFLDDVLSQEGGAEG